ncbi:hypothetical protein CDL15_Pgr015046 [Punica granatum]|uniref:Uncharacterized protein n=1 Tax=Punica granatum TaxID=22663 RepID=A0A218WZR0_PUNGR|nr:hypothetical protein CDL15_Pgr015046 [Punica granatum]
MMTTGRKKKKQQPQPRSMISSSTAAKLRNPTRRLREDTPRLSNFGFARGSVGGSLMKQQKLPPQRTPLEVYTKTSSTISIKCRIKSEKQVQDRSCKNQWRKRGGARGIAATISGN